MKGKMVCQECFMVSPGLSTDLLHYKDSKKMSSVYIQWLILVSQLPVQSFKLLLGTLQKCSNSDTRLNPDLGVVGGQVR